MRKIQGRFGKLVLSILTIILFVVVCEVAVRIVKPETFVANKFFVINRDLDYPDVMLRDSELFWKLRPAQTVSSDFFDGDTIRINSRGLRGAEIADKGNRKRIVALGNSCTFGWGVEQDSTFAVQLEKLLGPNYQTINAGVPGYTSYQGKIFYENNITRLKPDILLIMFGWNDHWPAGNKISDNKQQFPPASVVIIQNQLARLHSYRLLRKWLLKLIENKNDNIPQSDELVFRVGIKDFLDNLLNICQSAKLSGAKPVLLTSPIAKVEDFSANKKLSSLHNVHSQYNDAIRTLAQHESIELIDLAAEFDKHDSLFELPSYDPIHFNSKGHRLSAEFIARRMDSLIN